ncbi:MAG TPA: SusC/RagA family TonB-linked outer membrane protein [Longimicrobiales bacterium]|nr:SusC/RagA family TonB-linked outer membrane protein [Longimicrobiales bacterium]
MRRNTMRWALLLGLLLPTGLAAQGTGRITGVIRSDALQPLAGVQVSVQGTQLGTLSAPDGRYTISDVPVGRQVVQAVMLGYGTRQVTVTVAEGAAAVANFQLQAVAVAMRELVVVGYGTQRREQVTGAVESVTSDQFNKGPARDVASLVAGKVPGLAVVQPTGDPTATAQIQLRGMTTVQGPTNPLVLIDGVPGDLQTVPAEDIDAITVLKDGSASAIYGTRASNGVILITTKRYQGGKPTLRYDGYIGESTIYKSPQFLTAGDYRRMIADGYKTSSGTTFEDLGSSTNWQDQVLRQPVSYLHNLTLTGGAQNTNYTASLNMQDEQGIFQRSDNRELTARANIRHQMFDGRLEVEANVLSRDQKNFTGPSFSYAWRQALIRNPTDRVRDDDGEWQQRSGYFYVNPVSLIDEQDGEREERATRLHGTVTLRPVQPLRFSLMGGTSRLNGLSGTATTFEHPDNTQGNNGGYARRDTWSNVDRILEATGTYAEQFGSHDFTLLGGYSYQDYVEESFRASNTRFPTDIFEWNQLDKGTGLINGEPGTGIGSTKEGYRLIGFFGRLNYDWKNRYLLMASVRHEGNSKFGAAHKWGTFPAVSAGWRISEERFMKNALPFLNDLRLRAGYGVTGIAPDDPYLSLTSYAYRAYFLYNGSWVQQLAPARNPNPNLRWEEKHEVNVGLNLAAFDSRLTGAVDVYRRETKDMLYSYSVPVPPYLTGSILANVGTMRNSGVEVELGYDVVKRPGLTWTTSANWSTNHNKLVSLSDETFQPQSDCRFDGGTGEPIQQSTHRNCVGQPIGDFYGYKSVGIDDDGVWLVEDSAGKTISIKDATAKDRHVLGNGVPKYNFAWNNNAQIGSFDVSVNMRGAAGFQILNFMRMFYENPKIVQYNMLKSAFDPVYGKRPVNYDLAYVSYYIEDGDYLKLDNATLGYTLKPGQLGRFTRSLSSARLYVSGRNLLTLTGYKGMDPEVPLLPSGAELAPGNDQRDQYPTVRRFTFGMTVSF